MVVVERQGILEFAHFRYAVRFISQVCVSGLSNLLSWQRPAAIFMKRLAMRSYENKSCVSNLLNYNEIFTIHIQFINVTVGHLTQTGEQRVE
jgi:hypothetical protein